MYRGLGNKVLGRMYGPKRNKVTQNWTKKQALKHKGFMLQFTSWGKKL
jgi:hypothetical protein